MNIVLVVFDTLRAKEFREKPGQVAPFLYRMKKEQSYVDNYYSNASWTAPAHATLLTGNLPSEHGVITKSPFFDQENELANMLKERGFTVKGVSENEWFSPFGGFDKGFDAFKQFGAMREGESWREIWEKDSEFSNRLDKYGFFIRRLCERRDLTSLSSLLSYSFERVKSKFEDKPEYNPGHADEIIEWALDELKDSQDDLFLFMNLMPVHSDYTFSEKEKSDFLPGMDPEVVRKASSTVNVKDYYNGSPLDFEDFEVRRKTYKASIRYADSKMEELFSEAPKDTKFVVLGDHGELLGEYSLYDKKLIGHQIGTFKELIDVPFFVFSKRRDVNLKLDDNAVYSHKNFISILKNLINDKEDISNTGDRFVRSEYFGYKGLFKFSDKDQTDRFRKFGDRKSFSLVTQDLKYDLTTEGPFLWDNAELTESSSISLDEAPEWMLDKADILYGSFIEDRS
jgi:arylsulfatase A-like enzyme